MQYVVPKSSSKASSINIVNVDRTNVKAFLICKRQKRLDGTP
jgi:hypothetical protein